jgi:flagellar biosynthesis/type III secretory pathway chaperone
MNVSLMDLAGILEQEIVIAEELERNLAAQKQAVIDWNMDKLLAEIEARGPLLRSLDELERQRLNCLGQAGFDDNSVKLRQLIANLPSNSAERERLAALQRSTKATFQRLQADEHYLHELMENLLAHIHGALNSLLAPQRPTYGESGAAELARPAPTLFHGKA